MTESSRPRMAIFVDDTMHTPEGYIPSVAFENRPDFVPLSGNGPAAAPWLWGHDLAKAREMADRANADLGLTPEEAREIVLSGMRAQGVL